MVCAGRSLNAAGPTLPFESDSADLSEHLQPAKPVYVQNDLTEDKTRYLLSCDAEDQRGGSSDS